MTRLLFSSWLNCMARPQPRTRRRSGSPSRQRRRLVLESLEGRWVPSTVTNVNDAGAGSLRQAILDTPAGGKVDFQPGLTGTITLTTGELAVNKDLTIAGPGAGTITVSGNQSSWVFDLTSTQATVSLAGLTIANGSAQTGGGVYIAGGTVTLTNCVLNHNQVVGRDGSNNQDGASVAGGGLYIAGGTVAIDHLTFSANKATGGNGGAGITAAGGSGGSAEGGAVFVATGTVTVTDSAFSANQAIGGNGGNSNLYHGGNGGQGAGGGMFVSSGTVDVTNGAVADSQATGGVGGSGRFVHGQNGAGTGGALYVATATVHLTQGTLSTNQAVGGVSGLGSGPGLGGGIYSENAGRLTVTTSTLNGNSADNAYGANGGGIYSIGTLTVTNSILNGNQSGGIYAATATVTDSGISDNTGGGIVISNGGTLSLTNCTISSNNGRGIGSSVPSGSGTLTIAGCIISDNLSHGIAVDGMVSITDSTISHNAGTGVTEDSPGTLTVTNSTISGNTSGYGGISSTGTLIVTHSTISGNSSEDFGGGIKSQGTATVTNSIISGNSAYGRGGGIDFSGTLTVTNSTISGNSVGYTGYGGGITASGGTLIVTNSTISGNVDNGGVAGGIVGGPMTITDSTISDNIGGGINGGVLTVITNSTISGNTGYYGGIFMNAMAVLRNTIIAGNSGPEGSDIGYGSAPLASQGHNLIGDGTGASGFTDTDLVGTSSHPLDPKLGPVQDNGGPTQTMALLPDSPAIDAGDNTAEPAFDQRGPGFPRTVNGATDIGAFETQPATTFRVTTTADAGPGSLRQAILDADAHPGLVAIAFAIPGSGIHTISPTAPLPVITNAVVLDGSTQPGYATTPVIELTGAHAGPGADGLTVAGGRSTILGLVINDFANAGIHALVAGADAFVGDYIGTDATGTAARGNRVGIFLDGISGNTIGGIAGAGNLISGNHRDGVFISVSSNNVVEGNHIGTDVSGTAALPNGSGIFIQGYLFNNLIGGTAPGAGNLISGNLQDGVGIDGGTGNRVQGNLIGTDATGTTALPNRYGIELFSGSWASIIGGSDAGAGNVIAGNRLDGVGIYSDDNVLQGDFIGTDVSGRLALGNGRNGVAIRAFAYGFNNNVFGGSAPNVIAYNGRDGVLVDRGTGNAIQENRIFANGHLGIELRHHGNQDQAAPALTSATVGGSTLAVVGTLTSVPDTTFTLEFFANTDTGAGEGEVFLGSLIVTTDAQGQATFTANLAAINPGEFVTATATDPAGNTSEFCASVVVTVSGIATLDVPGAYSTTAAGINNAGQIVGTYYGPAGSHGFLLSAGNYITLEVPGGRDTGASGINDAGQIVGSYADAGNNVHGFMLSAGVYTTLDVPGATWTLAYGINDAGQVVGYYQDVLYGPFHGFLLSGGNYTTVDVPGAYETVAYGINDAGQIVGFYMDNSGNVHGFLLSGGSYTPFDVPGAYSTVGRGINDAGQIVGYYQDADLNTHGFLLSGDNYTMLDVPGAVYTDAYGINGAGQVVGVYEDADGNVHGFVATTPPSVPDSLRLPMDPSLVAIYPNVEMVSEVAPKAQGCGLASAVGANPPTDVGKTPTVPASATPATELAASRGDMALVDDFFASAAQDDVFQLSP
jgi:probable HAF family extracellular repeat protein